MYSHGTNCSPERKMIMQQSLIWFNELPDHIETARVIHVFLCL